jgi:hypothetical protein
MLETLSYYPRTDGGRHVNQRTFDTYSLKLILYVTSQVSESHTEKVRQQRSTEAQTLVLEVVFVVLLSSSQLQLYDAECHFTEEYGFVSPVLVAPAQVRQEVLVQGGLGFLQPVLFDLSVGYTISDE